MFYLCFTSIEIGSSSPAILDAGDAGVGASVFVHRLVHGHGFFPGHQLGLKHPREMTQVLSPRKMLQNLVHTNLRPGVDDES